MPRCTVCSHPERYDIDRALLTGNATYESLSRRHGPSTSALYRHRRHLQENISQARQRLKNNLSLGFLFKLNNFLDRTENASRKAEAEDNVDQVLKAARVGNRIIRDLSKMETPWDSDTVYRLMASPQWTSQDILLPTDPAFLASGHQTLANTFFQTCPEPPASQDAEDDDAVDCGEPESPALSSLAPEILEALHPELLDSLLANLTQPPAPATPPQRQREKSAKLARKKHPLRKNNKENQKDKSAKKNLANRPANSLADVLNEAPGDDGAPPAIDPYEQEYLTYLYRMYGYIPDAEISSGLVDACAVEYFLQEIAPGLPATPAPPDPELESSPSPVPGPPASPDTSDPGPLDPDKPLNFETHPVDHLFALTHGYRRDNPLPSTSPTAAGMKTSATPEKLKIAME